MTPSFLRRLFAILFVAAWLGGTVGAQDTRGSVVPDGKITLANGTTVEVQEVKAGALLWTWLPSGKTGTTKVTATRRQHSDSFLLVKVGDRELRATGAHRIALAGGNLVRLDTIKPGDKVWVGGAAGPIEAAVGSVRVFPSTLITYDLTVEGHGLFLLDGVMVGD